MSRINVNKLFPRLPIRGKLLIAFAALVVVPLVVTGAFGTRETLRQIEASVTSAIEHELVTASDRTEHFLLGAEEDLVYLAEAVVRPALEESLDTAPLLAEFLERKPRFHQVRLLTTAGDPIAVAPERPVEEIAGGAYYAYRAHELTGDRNALLAVELRDGGEGVGTVPAFAVVHPIRNPTGEIAAILVGEVRAARLFETLEAGPPGLGGTTGIVDADGQYLYHSERKRDWNTLLATRPDVNLTVDLGAETAHRMLTAGSGTVRTPGDGVVAARALRLEGPDGRPLRVFRSVPAEAIGDPARRFLRFVGIGGFLVLGAAMVAAVVAATQFTRPIYRLREEARRVAGGERGERPRIETNDEIEDLANDFAEMADRLDEHRRDLEGQVAARTAELRQAHAEIDEILAHTDEAILRLDADGRVRVWNQGATAIFGWSRDEALGRRLEDLVGGGAGDRSPEAREGRAVLRRSDGAAVEVGMNRGTIRGPDGGVAGYTVVIRDETRQRAFERRMLHSERLAAAGRVAAGVVHEINNPIGIIVNRIDCMRMEMDERCETCAPRADLAVIRHQAERVGAVARRLLAWAREGSEERSRVDVNEIAEGVLAFLGPEARKREIALRADLEPDLPPVKADPQGIESVLLNLALNAIDASSAGGSVEITTRDANAGSAVAIEVSDEGSGIRPEDLERVFEPFFTTKVQPRGTGLGLAVCQGVVQSHGGDIHVTSVLGGGSAFRVILPVAGTRS